MSSKAQLLQISRKMHLYIGVFIAPALLFFAFTGAVQTLSYHEAAGSSYKPPALLASLGQIHKHQTYVLPVRRPPEASGQAAPQKPSPPVTPAVPVTLATKQKQHLPLKIFFVLVSLGLFISTLSGIYMAYKYDRNKLLVTGLLVAGAILPLLLIRF